MRFARLAHLGHLPRIRAALNVPVAQTEATVRMVSVLAAPHLNLKVLPALLVRVSLLQSSSYSAPRVSSSGTTVPKASSVGTFLLVLPAGVSSSAFHAAVEAAQTVDCAVDR